MASILLEITFEPGYRETDLRGHQQLTQVKFVLRTGWQHGLRECWCRNRRSSTRRDEDALAR